MYVFVPKLQRNDLSSLAYLLTFPAFFLSFPPQISFGILGKPLKHFNRSTLIPNGEQKNNWGEGDSRDPESDVNNNSEDHPGIHAGGSRSSLMGPKMTGLARYSSTTHINTRNSAAAIPCHTDCPLSVTRV